MSTLRLIVNNSAEARRRYREWTGRELADKRPAVNNNTSSSCEMSTGQVWLTCNPVVPVCTDIAPRPRHGASLRTLCKIVTCRKIRYAARGRILMSARLAWKAISTLCHFRSLTRQWRHPSSMLTASLSMVLLMKMDRKATNGSIRK